MIAVVSLKFGEEAVIFVGNTAGGAGGAVSVTGVGIGLRFVGVQFRSNVAQLGDAVHIASSGTAVGEGEDGNRVPEPTTFERCDFMGNTSTAAGGAVNSGSGLDAFGKSRFVRNTARAGGVMKLAGTASILHCAFIENVSGEDEGPAVSNAGAITANDNASFFDNTFDCPAETFLDFTTGTVSVSIMFFASYSPADGNLCGTRPT